MTLFVDQELFTADGVTGDCWRACVATLMERPGSAVPHFVELHGDEWLSETNRWLLNEFGTELTHLAPLFPIVESARRYVILVGGSPRGNHRHAVLGDALTGALVHDPHPSRDGLTSIDTVYAFTTFHAPDCVGGCSGCGWIDAAGVWQAGPCPPSELPHQRARAEGTQPPTEETPK